MLGPHSKLLHLNFYGPRKDDMEANIQRIEHLKVNRACHLFHDAVLLKGMSQPFKKCPTKMTDENYYGSQKAMIWAEMMRDVVINDSGVKGSCVRRPFVCLMPIVEGSNAQRSMLVYYSDKKGAPLDKGTRVRAKDGPVYSLEKQLQKGLAPYFWCKYLEDKCKLHQRCVEKWMNCLRVKTVLVGSKQSGITPHKVTNKFLNRETSCNDAVDREFVEMGIENWD